MFKEWKIYLAEQKRKDWDSAHVVLIKNDKVLLLQRSFNDHWKPGKWAFPGGMKDKNETLEDSVKREVKEETGLTVELENLHYLPEISYKLKHAFYACNKVAGKLEINSNGTHEHEDGKWLEKKEISNFETVPDVLEVVKEAYKLLGV